MRWQRRCPHRRFRDCIGGWGQKEVSGNQKSQSREGRGKLEMDRRTVPLDDMAHRAECSHQAANLNRKAVRTHSAYDERLKTNEPCRSPSHRECKYVE